MKETKKKDIRELNEEGLKAWLEEHNEKPFRAKQILEWIWKHSARSIDEMTNLSLKLRQDLEADFDLLPVTRSGAQVSNDGTIKNAFRLHDQHLVEGVLIPTDTRMTACISSQVGCSLSCKFCATGKLKRLRNLTGGEIYDQVVLLNNQALETYGKPLTNIVYMGMGEPLLNYRGVMESVHWITSPKGLGMSPKRITVSTAGISKIIKKLADDEARFNLALSLHAANDQKRDQIMPINEQNSLDSLAEALRYYHGKTGNQVTYEYIIFKDFNDELKDAAELEAFCRIVPSKVNIIEYNPIDGEEFEQADPEKTDAFAAFLENRKINVNVRRSRGKDIDAACGQLANKLKPA